MKIISKSNDDKRQKIKIFRTFFYRIKLTVRSSCKKHNTISPIRLYWLQNIDFTTYRITNNKKEKKNHTSFQSDKERSDRHSLTINEFLYMPLYRSIYHDTESCRELTSIALSSPFLIFRFKRVALSSFFFGRHFKSKPNVYTNTRKRKTNTKIRHKKQEKKTKK